MNTKYNELEEVYEVDLKNTSGAELLAIETPNKYVTYAGLERAVRNVLSKAKDYDKGLAGGYNGTFPLTAATKGNIYLLPATKKYYICITDYNGSKLTTPNANFEELSVYTNRSKLDNLVRVSELIYINNNSEELTKNLVYKYNNNSCNASDGTIFIILFKNKTSSDYVQHILLKETRAHSIQVLGFSSNPMQLDLNDTYFRFYAGTIPQNFILFKIYKIKN